MSTNQNEEQFTFDGVVVSDENTKVVEEPVVEQVEPTPVQTPEQPQVMQQVPVQTANPVYTAPMGMKKPKKVGWIITLVFLIVSLIGVGIGTGVAVNGITSFAKNMDSEAVKKNEKPIENLGDGEFLISSLESGETYIVVSSITSGPKITGVQVDGVPISEENTFESTNRNSTNWNIYSFTATDTAALLTLKGVTAETVGDIHVVPGSEYVSSLMLTGVGGIIVAIAGFIAFINLVLFIIFLTIFLTRNSKYKQSLR